MQKSLPYISGNMMHKTNDKSFPVVLLTLVNCEFVLRLNIVFNRLFFVAAILISS